MEGYARSMLRSISIRLAFEGLPPRAAQLADHLVARESRRGDVS
jgi:hypothetical protein